MEYILKNANVENFNYLKEAKLYNILKYAENLTQSEMEEINNYVLEELKEKLENYQMIIAQEKIVGCILVEQNENGVIIDELYLDENYRNKKIGSTIIENIKKDNNKVYLWVYKNNINAVKLYKKLNFKIIEETGTRYYMKYE